VKKLKIRWQPGQSGSERAITADVDEVAADGSLVIFRDDEGTPVFVVVASRLLEAQEVVDA
jgi:hypothetical protein